MARKEDRFPVVTQANHITSPRQGTWSYRYYATIPDEQRYEIIDGVLYIAPPAHTSLHKRILSSIGYYLYAHITLKDRGNVLLRPIDVELTTYTVVQPDLVVLLGPLSDDFFSSSHIIGAPDLV